MKTTPEFMRQMWLNATTMNMVVVPVIMLLVFYTATLIEFHPESALYHVAKLMLYGLLLIWAPLKAAASFTSEFETRTWDWQQLSPQSAVNIMAGKLLGSVAPMWILSMLCVLAMIYADRHHAVSDDALFYASGIFFFVAAFVQAMAFAIATSLRGDYAKEKKNFGHNSPAIIAIMGGLFIIKMFDNSPFSSRADDAFFWYGIETTVWTFAILSLSFFTAWFLFAGWRRIRDQLMYRNYPWGWPLFLGTLMVYLGGFKPPNGPMTAVYVPELMLMISLFAAWFAAMGESADLLQQRRVQQSYRQKNYPAFFASLPNWTVNIAIGFVFWVFIIVFPIEGRLSLKFLPDFWNWRVSNTLLAAPLFVIRDIILFHAITMNTRVKISRYYLLAYLFVIYGLLPVMFISLFDEKIVYAFFPFGAKTWIEAIGPILFQVMAGLALYVSIAREQRKKIA